MMTSCFIIPKVQSPKIFCLLSWKSEKTRKSNIQICARTGEFSPFLLKKLLIALINYLKIFRFIFCCLINQVIVLVPHYWKGRFNNLPCVIVSSDVYYNRDSYSALMLCQVGILALTFSMVANQVCAKVSVDKEHQQHLSEEARRRSSFFLHKCS